MRKRGWIRKLGRVVAALFGAGFVYAAFIYLTLPDVRPLRTANPDTTAFMELRSGEARAKGEAPKKVQRWVPYSPYFPRISRAPCWWRRTRASGGTRASSSSRCGSRSKRTSSASSSPGAAAPSRSSWRRISICRRRRIRSGKRREILIARRLEAELTKQRILELYLNVIEWGDDVYGAEAAARTYFGKSAAELGPQESALLAAAIINPHVHSPGRPTARLRRRQQMIMRRMGAVTPPPVVAESPAAQPADTPRPPLPDAPAPSPAGATPPPALPGAPVLPVPPLPPCDRPPCGLSD